MNYWLHRISHHAEISYPLLGQGKLSIGFSDYATPEKDGLLPTKQDFEKGFVGTWIEKDRRRHTLNRFLFDIKIGDWIVVPSWGTFSIHEVVSDSPKYISDATIDGVLDLGENKLCLKNSRLHTESGKLVDLGFFIDVKQIASGISRSKFADAKLTSKMKCQHTNLNINDIEISIKDALDSYTKDKPVNLYAEILDKSASFVFDNINKYLNPAKFETLIKWYFTRIGATDVVIPPKNERGKVGDVDIVATFDGIKTIICVQAKFHTGVTASDWAINQILDYRNSKDLMDDGYTRLGWVISSAESYSELCYTYAKENKIQLLDGKEFSRMIVEAGITSLDMI